MHTLGRDGPIVVALTTPSSAVIRVNPTSPSARPGSTQRRLYSVNPHTGSCPYLEARLDIMSYDPGQMCIDNRWLLTSTSPSLYTSTEIPIETPGTMNVGKNIRANHPR